MDVRERMERRSSGAARAPAGRASSSAARDGSHSPEERARRSAGARRPARPEGGGAASDSGDDDDPARIPSKVLDANLDPLAREALLDAAHDGQRPGRGGVFAEGDQRTRHDRIRGERRARAAGNRNRCGRPSPSSDAQPPAAGTDPCVTVLAPPPKVPVAAPRSPNPVTVSRRPRGDPRRHGGRAFAAGRAECGGSAADPKATSTVSAKGLRSPRRAIDRPLAARKGR